MRAAAGGIGAWLALLGGFHAVYGGFFPNESGRVGHDFAFFLPAYLDGYVWFEKNGALAVPWFTPSFCAGVPLFPDPQSGYYSVPQWLSFAVDPLSASYLTLVLFASLGYFGMYRLCRGVFGLSPALSVLAGGLYFLNGCLPHRMIVGEPSFHALPLVPWIAFWLLAPARDGWRATGYATLAGLAGTYAVHSGLNVLMVPAGLGVVAIGAMHALGAPWRHEHALRAAAAVAVCLAGAASKIVAGVAYLGTVPRVTYAWPGFPGLLDVGRVAALALFAPSETTTAVAAGRLWNVGWTVLPHEWAYGFTVAPLVAVLAVVPFGRGGASRPPASRTARVVAGVVLAVVLGAPLAFMHSTPELVHLYTSLPVIGQSSWPMRWLVLYLPLVPLATALGLGRALGSRPRLAVGVTVATLAAALVLTFLEPREYYRRQPYDPGPVLATHARFVRGEARGHAIRAVGVFTSPSGQPALPLNRNDAFLQGVSSMLCYNPIFGYRLERFPVEGLVPGPVLGDGRGRLNFKNPACYVYPRENGCRPGDHFRVDERPALEQLVDYRPMPFAVSRLQHAAGWTSTVVLGGTGAFLALWGLVEAHRAWRPR